MNKARRDYYTNFVNENSNDQRKLFKVSRSLLNLNKTFMLPPHSNDTKLANKMGTFFVQKISSIRSKLDEFCSPHLSNPVPTGSRVCETCTLIEFERLSEESVRKLILGSNKNCCILDPIPMKLLIDCLDILLPVITRMVNSSLCSGLFPDVWKSAVVLPLLKKPGLDLKIENFRPISNLHFVSKLVEQVVANQLQCHLSNNNLLPSVQSAYRKHHSTETALLKVRNDLLMAMNKQHVSLFVLLDLSSAFDTLDHQILLRTLEYDFGIKSVALLWFKSYLSNRSQRVLVNGNLSQKFDLEWGVPQGSCLGPLLFNMYTSRLFNIFEKHLPNVHCYADDTQLYLSFCPDNAVNQASALFAMEACVRKAREWMLSNGLMLNDTKTEFMVIGTRQQLAKVNIHSIKVGSFRVTSVPIVKNLGAWFDNHMNMNTHITKACSTSFYLLHNIRRIRKYLSKICTEKLIHAFISSRLDYCNSLLYGLPDNLINQLQRVQNSCARLVCNENKYCHITPLLVDLHWLPVSFRINFKILLIVYKALNGQAPSYLCNLLTRRSLSKYCLRSFNDTSILRYPLCKTKSTLGDRAFECVAPKLWNSLPHAIRIANNTATFKTLLKTHLFRQAFY